MNVADLIKATIVFGLIAFLVYTFPILGQVSIIALVGLLWLSCAFQVFTDIRRKGACRF
ncbi:MAG: hypothetical protein M1608_18335 [Candidatus Omnitrophica bacterium]|nr:hypothetical protein [Candidatus Omnitrophota bacterium]